MHVVAQRLGLLPCAATTLTVAGTNGKGSSATLASLIYRAAGYRVGLYTSPHLFRYNERIAIDGAEADDAALCAAFAAIEAARGDTPLTYFEFGTLAALWLFRASHVEVQVLEVGLGGRLDAVNIVDADCALLTNIGFDHLDWLGSDLESIGLEKAGVFRRARAAICAEAAPPASVERVARDIGADLQKLDRDYGFQQAADAASWRWEREGNSYAGLPLPGLRGRAQLRNAAGVLAAVENLQARLPVTEAALREALPQLRLRGRYERRGHAIFDVAHNAEATTVLAENLCADGLAGRVLLVLGMLADKPVEAVCRRLAPLVRAVFFASLPGPRGLTAEALKARAGAGGLDGIAAGEVADAWAQAWRAAGADDIVLVCGSFLTVAAAAKLEVPARAGNA